MTAPSRYCLNTTEDLMHEFTRHRRRPAPTVTRVAGNPYVLLVRTRIQRIGPSWYRVQYDRGQAGFRKLNGAGSWGYYFRGVDGHAIGRQEYHCSSREQAIRRVMRGAVILGWRQA